MTWKCVGCGNKTLEKQRIVRAITRVVLKIWNGIRLREGLSDPIVIIDCYAGPGRYKVEGVIIEGSPLIFIEEAEALGIPIELICIEKNRDAARNLELEVGDRATVIVGDCRDVLPELEFTGQRIGFIYVDPNGTLPMELLVGIRRYRWAHRMDLLLNYQATAHKRAHGSPRFSELTEGVGKQHWILRPPSGKWQSTIAIGTNWPDFPKLKKYGFVSSTTPVGMSIVERLSLTNAELGRCFREQQLDLPGLCP